MRDGETGIDPAPHPAMQPTLVRLFLSVAWVACTSLGGGLSGWMLREFVTRRQWLTEGEFFSGLAVAQVLPGVNIVNLSIWIGWRLLGLAGAVTAALAMILPGLAMLSAIYAVFAHLQGLPWVRHFLAGAIAVALGVSLYMGLIAARRLLRHAVPLALLLTCFTLAGPLHYPGVPVMVSLGIAGVAWEWWVGRHA
jgi:chromate transporter